jgi:head-tail adaptor
MRIGRLRHQVYIQTPTVATSDRGAQTVTWTDSPRVAAWVETVSGSERNAEDLLVPTALHEVVIRWPLPTGTEITTKSRIKWLSERAGSTRYFGIEAIGEPDNRGRYRVLTCRELVGEDRVL